MFSVGETVTNSGSCQTAPFNFQLPLLSGECLWNQWKYFQRNIFCHDFSSVFTLR